MAEYNGWSNYATWRINLEIFDGTEEMWTEYRSQQEVAKAMKEYLEEFLEQEGKGVALDYAMAFVSDVDYHQIASHYYQEESEEVEEEV